jgi:hypothetical protein
MKLTAEQVCEILGVSKGTIAGLMTRGDLVSSGGMASTGIRRILRFDEAHVRALASRRAEVVARRNAKKEAAAARRAALAGRPGVSAIGTSDVVIAESGLPWSRLERKMDAILASFGIEVV